MIDLSTSSKLTEMGEKATLARRIGEGSFVGFKKINTPEELIEWLKHLYAYMYTGYFAEDKCILDVGCGTGYGIHELSTKAHYTVGNDIRKEVINYSFRKYGEKTSFLIASGLNLPFRENSFDLVVSFQVIEHINLKIVINYLREIKQILKNNGIFIVTTPNRKLRLLPFQKPWNPDHKKEYDAKELESVLKKVFKKVDVLGLFATKDAFLIEYNRVKQNPFYFYIIKAASLITKHVLPPSFIDMIGRLLIPNRRKITPILKKSNKISPDFSLKDFQISRQNLQACIDIYGLCVK